MAPIQMQVRKLEILFITNPTEALFQASEILDIEEYEAFAIWADSFVAGPWL